MKLLIALATTALLAAPAAACEFDGMPGFSGHGFRSWMTDEEAAIVRQEAMEEARKAFLATHNLKPDPTTPDQAPTTTAEAPASASPVPDQRIP
jgi:hypothetical protein